MSVRASQSHLPQRDRQKESMGSSVFVPTLAANVLRGWCSWKPTCLLYGVVVPGVWALEAPCILSVNGSEISNLGCLWLGFEVQGKLLQTENVSETEKSKARERQPTRPGRVWRSRTWCHEVLWITNRWWAFFLHLLNVVVEHFFEKEVKGGAEEVVVSSCTSGRCG